MSIAEHEVLVFERVKSGLDSLDSDSHIYRALGGSTWTIQLLSISGTFGKPDVNLILQESTPSSFGRGETTVLDPTYRNGKEISAINTDITSESFFCRVLAHQISATMFAGNPVEVKFYKLAVYEEGGHFDWHMDSTHSDRHHATLLVALNTLWEGGDLKLRRNDVETLVDMHPKSDGDGGGVNLQATAFFTDTEHKVEPVTKGIRIVLQFDVEVAEAAEPPEIDDDDDEDLDEHIKFLGEMEGILDTRMMFQDFSDSLAVDKSSVTKVTNIIAGLFADGEKEVALAMQYLYRKSSILPKGTDAQLYNALVGRFDVSLRPVVLHSTSDWDGRFEPVRATIWGKGDQESAVTEFHLPMVSAIRKISYKEYVEHTGNEAQEGDMRYFGGGMFVRQKKDAEKQ